jgi:hypothetical protein
MAQHAFQWAGPLRVGPLKAGVLRRTRPRGSVLAPRMSTAAVRIPEPVRVHWPPELPGSGPQIFVHEGARQTLQRRIELAMGGPAQLAVTDNLRRMVTHTRSRGTLRVRMHMMFLDAPERVKEALVRYVARGDRDASQVVGEYIDLNSFRIRAERPVTHALRTRGKVHDLQTILQMLNTRYFGGMASDAQVTWGRRTAPRGATRAAIKLGTYSATERLIRVHPALDQRWVPRYFVAYIVFHELLHHVIPPVRLGRATTLHPLDFVQQERGYPHYERAIDWERRHLDRLLRFR